jgi:Protein of unknown function (DUF2971)
MGTNSNIPLEKKVVKPETIFKYEAFSAQSLKNLKAQSIYFGSPLGFNDPYDCALKPRMIEPSSSDLHRLWGYFQAKEPLLMEFKEEGNAIFERFKSVFTQLADERINENLNELVRKIGVTCFSENNSDLLMWAHYGGKYKGFCLEFKTNTEPFAGIRKVNYVDEIPKIDAVPVWIDQNTDMVIDLLCTKSKSWEYEKEWRIIHQEAGTLFVYEPDALKSVYFGPDIDVQSLEIVCLILAGQNSNIKFWKGKRSQDRFEVEFEEIGYINHLDAKSKGLR